MQAIQSFRAAAPSGSVPPSSSARSRADFSPLPTTSPDLVQDQAPFALSTLNNTIPRASLPEPTINNYLHPSSELSCSDRDNYNQTSSLPASPRLPLTGLHGGTRSLIERDREAWKPNDVNYRTPSRTGASSPRHFMAKVGLHDRSRNVSAASFAEREPGISSAVHAHRSAYPASSTYLLTVVPPSNFQARTGSSLEHFRRGTLLPLYPTLGGQLYAIAREYGLPSVGGLSVYLVDDGEGNLGPRIGDSAWSALWSTYFDEVPIPSESVLPLPQSTPSQSFGRLDPEQSSQSAFPESEGQEVRGSNASDVSRSSGVDSDPRLAAQVTGSRTSPMVRPHSKQMPDNEASSPASHSASWSLWNGSDPSRSRITSRSGPLPRVRKLPIVGKIEWIVDEAKAKWWESWSRKRAARLTGNATSAEEAMTSRLLRRSLHLGRDLQTDTSGSKSRQSSPSPERLHFSPTKVSSPSSAPQKGVPHAASESGTDDHGDREEGMPDSILSHEQGDISDPDPQGLIKFQEGEGSELSFERIKASDGENPEILEASQPDAAEPNSPTQCEEIDTATGDARTEESTVHIKRDTEVPTATAASVVDAGERMVAVVDGSAGGQSRNHEIVAGALGTGGDAPKLVQATSSTNSFLAGGTDAGSTEASLTPNEQGHLVFENDMIRRGPETEQSEQTERPWDIEKDHNTLINPDLQEHGSSVDSRSSADAASLTGYTILLDEGADDADQAGAEAISSPLLGEGRKQEEGNYVQASPSHQKTGGSIENLSQDYLTLPSSADVGSGSEDLVGVGAHVRILDGDDDAMWKELRLAGIAASERGSASGELNPHPALSMQQLSGGRDHMEGDVGEQKSFISERSHSMGRSGSDAAAERMKSAQDVAVQDWIESTSFGQQEPFQAADGAEDDQQERFHDFNGAEDDLWNETRSDDVQEVVSLWARKVATRAEIPLIDPPGSVDEDLRAHWPEKQDSGLDLEYKEKPSLSLLSPIALDASSFEGPRPRLGDLASSGQSDDLGPRDGQRDLELAQQNISNDPTTPGSSFEPVHYMATDGVAHSSLGIPTLGGIGSSRRSSGELSDSLEDMQKALELLSPGHSPVPIAQFGKVSVADGHKMSSRDSFAVAKTLSSSVTPSPRWFSRSKSRQRATPQSTYMPSKNATLRSDVSPRPASASATLAGSSQRGDLPVPSSASRLAGIWIHRDLSREKVWKDEVAENHGDLQAPNFHQHEAMTERPLDAYGMDFDSNPTNGNDHPQEGQQSYSGNDHLLDFLLDSTLSYSNRNATPVGQEEMLDRKNLSSGSPRSSEQEILTNADSGSAFPSKVDLEGKEATAPSIERFLRDGSFTQSSTGPSTEVSPQLREGNSLAHYALDASSMHGVQAEQESGESEVDQIDASDLERDGTLTNGSGDRWSQGSKSHSNWTGASRLSGHSSSLGIDREPGTPVFSFDRQLSEISRPTSYPRRISSRASKNDPNARAEKGMTDVFGRVSPERDNRTNAFANPDHSSAADLDGHGAQATISDFTRLHDNRTRDQTFRLSASTNGELGHKNATPIDEEELRAMAASTKAAVREALSPHHDFPPIERPSSSHSSKSLGHLSDLSHSPPSSGRRRASASNLSSKRRPALLSLDIDPAMRNSPSSRSGSFSPKQRFRTLPPSPSLLPNFPAVTSPLSFSFPPTDSAPGSPTAKGSFNGFRGN
ncbi:hypothetical protein IE53DRAFT_49705 [Violaceomyces palustris]|uniref:Uncharacterized protein n=1 Tax=Violaceomyces palustris TaxID=1673888 RepID=A0ACD0P7F4_9BASI|nr:hypothetical protein IE53DRAFT_49705 [Violaceomyces palustris]